MSKIINKVIFAINSIVAFALLLSYVLPYIPPKAFSLLSVLSLFVPVLIVVNVLFFIFWAVLLKKNMLLSLLVLILGISHVVSLYKLQGKNEEIQTKSTISLLSYNVHSFNRFRWIDSDKVPQDISKFVKKNDPDIFCAQEYYNNEETNFEQYKYKYEYFNNNRLELALVIFSKFPFIKKGSLNFEETANNTIFVDIALPKDTIRVYNVHLQSHRISAKTDELAKSDSQKLLERIEVSFKKQQEQTERLIEHMESSPYRNIVMGDFNNTAYSYVYNQIKSKRLQDAFKEAGKGFGKTFKFDLFPARIDFILVPDTAEVLTFDNFTVSLSDHYPIFSKIRLE